ncbi:MAG: hypothetical protein WCE49_07455, partial [Terrimicrobiaceae bacterium]
VLGRRTVPRLRDDRYEDGNQLVTFGSQGLQLVGGNQAPIDKEFQPVAGFFEFSKRVPTFGDEFGLAAGAIRFAVVGSHGRSGTEQLFPKHMGFGCFRQAAEKADDS